MPKSIREWLSSDDPLCAEALDALLTFREEDSCVDYKVEFHVGDEREWLEITKDIIAFANTYGGYLAFGVKDGSFEVIGLDEETAGRLSDPNNLLQKLNRFVEPPIVALRCKRFRAREKTLVAVVVPPSLGKTHVVSKDGSARFQSGQEKNILRQGTSYVRRSGANHLVDARDLDDIINRRIDHFRSSLLDKIARVVEAPQSSEVFVLSADPTAEPNTKFIVENSPDAIPVKGMSFTVSPATTEQEIAAWIAMTGKDRQAMPARGITWKWYRERKTVELGREQRVQVARYALLTEVPVFYWLKDCNGKEVKAMLANTMAEALESGEDIVTISNIASAGAFLGKRFHQSLLTQLGARIEKLSPAERVFPVNGPRSLFRANRVVPKGKQLGESSHSNAELEAELNKIAESAITSRGHQPVLTDRWRAQTLDCFLYARDDQYAG